MFRIILTKTIISSIFKIASSFTSAFIMYSPSKMRFAIIIISRMLTKSSPFKSPVIPEGNSSKIDSSIVSITIYEDALGEAI